MRKINFIKIAGILLLGISVMACNQTGKDSKSEINIETRETYMLSYQVGDHVPNELVCMVNNAYMGKEQMEVPVGGKMYYGCCEMCVGRLNVDESARMATDPFSGNEVDKSQAYIVLSGKDGAVAYYENEDSYKIYKNQTESEQ